jgi:hypothetical protein
MNPDSAVEVGCVLIEWQAWRSKAALRHLKSQISNVGTEIWNLRSEIPSVARTGGRYKPLAHCLCSAGLAARSLCHRELRNPQ